MKTLTKALVGTVASAALVAGSAAPAFARDRHGHNGGISTGDVIAGALVIGGIAAIAAAASNNRDGRRYDDRYGNRGNDRYGYRGGDSRGAVEQCVYAAERSAQRWSYGNAKVTDIREVDRKRDGYVIKGRIAVNRMNRNWRDGDRHYGRGWGNDYRGWNSRYRGYDSGKFRCEVRYGRVVDMDIDGIRGL